MSGWRVLLKELEPGEWVPTQAFNGGALERWSIAESLRSIHERGFVERRRIGPGVVVEWRITQRGRDVLDGRVALKSRGSGTAGRMPSVLVATWLSSLPRAGEIQLGNA